MQVAESGVSFTVAGTTVQTTFDGASKTPFITSADPVAGGFGQVTYQNLYPGISLEFYGNAQGQIEYTWDVAAGANPNLIEMSIQGAINLAIDGQAI